MSRLEILCVTMHQQNFSKIQQMNIRTDVVFANQADWTGMDEMKFDGHRARMITTDTRGVGINRNLAMLHAQGEICLFADDDVIYDDDMENRILTEFDAHPDADIIIFHLDTDSDRKQVRYRKTRKCRPLERMPWGTFRIAFRRDAVRKANICFSTLFGGGCIFPSGEDSLWLTEARRKGMTFYVSQETIGRVLHIESTWFTGYDEKYYFGKGAFYQAARPNLIYLWMLYFVLRTWGKGTLTVWEKLRWMQLGKHGYISMKGYEEIAGQK